MRIDHTYLVRAEPSEQDLGSSEFDVFLSAYDSSERVERVYNAVSAKEKFWIIHPEYGFDPAEVSGIGPSIDLGGISDEVEAWLTVLDRILPNGYDPDLKLGIDITGLMRPYIALLPLMLARSTSLTSVSVLYADPRTYSSGINTQFTLGAVDYVGPIPGCEGVHNTSTNTADALIIGVGYDDALIRAVADFKRSADHFILLGLPSLQPHMYQESQLNLQRASESIHRYRSRSFIYAPASDPFVTAEMLGRQAYELRSARPDVNLYLSPVGPKAHVLGFGWFFACEETDRATSLIFPYAPNYSRGSAAGLSRIHRYELELTLAR